jgi:hypothetical protein
MDPSLVMPAVPTNVGPVVQWLMGIATLVISVSLPVGLAFFKQHLNNQTASIAVMKSSAAATAAALRFDRSNRVEVTPSSPDLSVTGVEIQPTITRRF